MHDCLFDVFQFVQLKIKNKDTSIKLSKSFLKLQFAILDIKTVQILGTLDLCGQIYHFCG